MRQRLPVWIILSALIMGGTFCVLELRKSRRQGGSSEPRFPNATSKRTGLIAEPDGSSTLLSRPTRIDFTEALAKAYAKQNRSQFPNRLSNTSLPLKQLAARDTAVLLQNALLDTADAVALKIPGHLQASRDPGAYIVQAKGPPDDAFRGRLKQAGATIVSYIPNNAYLVRVDEDGAQALRQLPHTQAVLK